MQTHLSVMKLICINDSARPQEIPTTHWVKKGQPYTAIKFDKLLAHGNRMGVQLEEIDLKPFAPYQYFGAWRFKPVEEVPEEELVEELVEVE